MPQYIAFLRAINVGGHTVKMADLRRLFEQLGFTAVETYIASGNAIFRSEQPVAELKGAIEAHLKAHLGYEVATFLRTPAELAQVAALRPLGPTELANFVAYSVAFLAQEPSPAAIQRLLAFPTTIDRFYIVGRECYWFCQNRVSDSKFSGAVLEKLLGMPATIRNTNTVQKLAALYPPE